MNITKNRKLITGWVLVFAWILLAFDCSKPGTEDKKITISTEMIYEPTTEIFPNPERGFIHTYAVHSAGQGLQADQLRNLRAENVTMILRIYYLDNFKNTLLSEAELLLITNDMHTLREAGIKAVLRFAYTDDINGTDAPLSTIEQHLDQLKPILEANKDVIAFVQAGFIGAWGEWHSSSNGLTTVENQKKVLFKLLNVLPEETMVQVRTPKIKQDIFNTSIPLEPEIAYTNQNRARVGHHNDCFLAGGTDYGTYTNIPADKEYISKEALYVPTGGETCPPVGDLPDCPTALAEMKLLKWTYLNLDWYQPVINAWKSSGCFDELQRNLGYRLSLVSGKFPKQAIADQNFKVEITLSNKGYAPLYNFKATSMVFINKTSGNSYSFNLPVDLRKVKPNGVLVISDSIKLAGIPKGDYDLYLNISDPSENLKNRVEYKVRLANQATWVQATGMNHLKAVVKITDK
ncbi:MAG: DUF4832 domain-containing protein [Ginsengibacter sp.]